MMAKRKRAKIKVSKLDVAASRRHAHAVCEPEGTAAGGSVWLFQRCKGGRRVIRKSIGNG
jgi:hypothetical protein